MYTGVEDAQPSRDVVTVTHRTRTIAGVPCIVVEDRLYLRGRLGERTVDWYSQDARGNVWYFGEQTAKFDHHSSVTSTEGTWRSGVDGARAGIFMPAHPHVGQTGQAGVLQGSCRGSLQGDRPLRTPSALRVRRTRCSSQETTPLEPGTVDHKLYVRGIGVVLEQTERGGDERNELVFSTRG